MDVVWPDEELKNRIEDYLNAPHSHGRPFVDYRPDIGIHLFPSHVTGNGIGRWRLRGILNRYDMPNNDPSDDNNHQHTNSIQGSDGVTPKHAS